MNSTKLFLESNQHRNKSLFEKYTSSRLETCQNLYRKTLLSHYACVNSVAFSANGELFVSGGDDKRVLLWKTSELSEMKKAKPTVMKKEHYSNIFSTIFDCSNRFVFSAGNDQQVLQHDVERLEAVGFFFFDDSIYAVDSPYDSPYLFAASGEDGTVQIVDVRSPLERTKLTSSGGSYHSAVFSPTESQLLATANSLTGVSLWDIRRPMKELTKLSCGKQKSGMSVKFDSLGNRLLALFRKGGPILYHVAEDAPMKYQFVHPKYRNVCTMKSTCFAGDKDEYVVSGSDDFNIYMWKTPEDVPDQGVTDVNEPHMILQGHRSIVNQVRYNKHHYILASAGVEKCVKLWSCFPMKGSKGDITNDEHYIQRTKFTHAQYLRLTADSGRLTHNYEESSTEEDPRMIALFDSLIERTQNDWASDTSSDTEGRGRDSRVDTILSLLFDNYTSSSSENEDSDNESSRTFGVTVDELRRIFRRNRETTTESETQNSERSTPRTMIDLNPTTLISEQPRTQSTINTSRENTCSSIENVHQDSINQTLNSALPASSHSNAETNGHCSNSDSNVATVSSDMKVTRHNEQNSPVIPQCSGQGGGGVKVIESKENLVNSSVTEQNVSSSCENTSIERNNFGSKISSENRSSSSGDENSDDHVATPKFIKRKKSEKRNYRK